MQRTPSGILVGCFLLLTGVVPVVEVGSWIGSGEGPLQAEALDGWMEERSWLREMLLPSVQRILHPLGWGNEKVYLGREGWLFYRLDVEHLTGAGFDSEGPFSALRDLKQQLQARGVRLVVVPVPAKPSIYPERLAQGASRGLRNPSTSELYRRLRQEGVEVLDLLPDFLGAKHSSPHLYLATDTHWSPAGMHLAARLLAERISPWLDSMSGNLNFSRRPTEVENRGDTSQMLPFDEDSHPVAPGKVTIMPVADELGQPWQPSQPSEVLLLGDSFSNIYSLPEMGWGAAAGLAEQVSFELGRPLQRIVINGQGAWSTRRELQRRLRQGEDLLSGKKAVVFQFAARELSFGDWQRLDLTLGSPNPESARQGLLEVEATIAACAQLPPSSSTPYPDLITSIHLVDLKVRQGSLPQSEIVAFLWAKRRGQEMAGAICQEGEQIRLRLEDWSSVEAELGRYCRVELDDPRLWDLEVFWAFP